ARRPASLSTAARTGHLLERGDAIPWLASRSTRAPRQCAASARERLPRAGVHPAHVCGERADVVLGEKTAVRSHLDRLALNEEAPDGMLPEASAPSLGDPLPQLVIAAHEVVEVLAPEPRHVALQRSGVREPAGTERAMARDG